MNYIKFQVHQINLETKLETDNAQISNFIKSSESHEKENHAQQRFHHKKKTFQVLTKSFDSSHQLQLK